MAAEPPVIVWFRDDLRLADHPALAAAARRKQPLICVFVLDEDSTGIRALGGASRWWLARSLQALDTDLRRLGQKLVLRRGAVAKIIPEIAKAAGASHAYWNRRYDRAGMAVDEQVIAALKNNGVAGGTFTGSLLIEPQSAGYAEAGPKVFTPFWKRLLARLGSRNPAPAPKFLPPPFENISGDRLADWKLEPSNPDWAGELRENWTPGEAAARERLADFLDGIKGYGILRDRPDRPATSRLSPHLRFGEISPTQIWQAAQFSVQQAHAPAADIDKFLSEVGWREFSYHLLHHHPSIANENMTRRFDAFPWRHDAAALQAWQRGRTGYPIVDAGMRQLWRTGWMHNRVRMITASFLVKHLLIDWREGERWFWDTLVDADPANNPASWQWVAGCGADAAPYFRVFNPVLQGDKFDPDGTYVREWVPELARLPDKFIHKPWTAPASVLKDANVTLGKSYAAPIVDHDMARKRALAALGSLKQVVA